MSYDAREAGTAAASSYAVRRARKHHTCSACGATIAPGHYYTSTGIVWEGTAATTKRCGSCELTYRHLVELGRPHGMHPREELDCGLDYAEEWETDPPEHIARLPLLSDAERGALLAPAEAR